MKKYFTLCAGLVILSSCSSSDSGGGNNTAAAGNGGNGGNSSAGQAGGSGSGGIVGNGGHANNAGGGAVGHAGHAGMGGTNNPSGGAGGNAAGVAGNEAGAQNGGAGGGGGGVNIPTGHATCTGAALPTLGVEPVATVNTPMFETSDPHDASRLFILERKGNVLLKVGAADPVQILAVTGVSIVEERGLLGMAFHPKYGVGDERRFYLAFAGKDGNSVSIYEYAMSATTPDTVDVTSEKLVRTTPHTNSNHNGGAIAFGPDGYLYWSIGDGGNQCDGQGSAQNLADKLGSIARIDVDHPDVPPAGNVSGAGVDTDIFHWGLRNPYRISFDMGTGDLYIGDVGQDTWEEISVAPMGSGGLNFGWPVWEGTHDCACCNTNKVLQPAGSQAVPPIFDYQHQGRSAVIGGVVYRGSLIPELVGRYIYADNSRNMVWVITYDGTKGCENTDVTAQVPVHNISGFGQDANGEVYINSLDGGVYHLIKAP